jgi:hypothetical protein
MDSLLTHGNTPCPKTTCCVKHEKGKTNALFVTVMWYFAPVQCGSFDKNNVLNILKTYISNNTGSGDSNRS